MLKQLHFDLSVKEISKVTANLSSYINVEISKVTTQPHFNAFERIDEIIEEIANSTSSTEFPALYTTNDKVKIASQKASTAIHAALTKAYSNKKVYEHLKKVKRPTDPEQQILYDKILHLFALHQSAEANKLAIAIHKLQLKFQTNIDAAATRPFELDDSGLPDEYKTTDHKYTTSADATNLIQTYATNPKSRSIVTKLFNERGSSTNRKILQQLREHRTKHAQLLGYKDHTELQLKTNMAKNSTNVRALMKQLRTTLIPKVKELCTNFNIQSEADVKFVKNQLLPPSHKDIFETEVVVENTIKYYADLFDVTITEHDKVGPFRKYQIITDKPIGNFYLDLYSRPGKYSHYAQFKLNRTNAAVICNFSSTSNLLFEEVQTFFHEFGHVMHELISKTKYYLTSGINVQFDFVEAPSQMLENWVNNPDVLQTITGHSNRETLMQIINVHKQFEPYYLLRRVWMAEFDLDVYETNVDLRTLWVKHAICLPFYPLGEGYNSFAHTATDYSSLYYTYMWSYEYSQKLYNKFDGPNDKATFKKYIDTILKPGGSKLVDDLIANFLNIKN